MKILTHFPINKIQILIPIIGLVLQGCEPIIPSIDLPTDSIFVDYDIDAYETEFSNGAAWFYQSNNYQNKPLDQIDLLPRSTIELSDEESCTLDINNDTYFMETLKKQTQDMKQDPRYWLLFSTSATWYLISELNSSVFGPTLSTLLPPLATGDQVSFNFNRASGEQLHSTVSIGEYPVITAPTNKTNIAHDMDELTVTWHPLSNANAPLTLHIGLRCTASQLTSSSDKFLQLAAITYDSEHNHLAGIDIELPKGATHYTATRSQLMEKIVVPAGVTQCAGGISMSYESKGILAPEFKGGRVKVKHNAKKIEFVLHL